MTLAAERLTIVFSPRELTIIRELLKDGADNQAIADRLWISLDTVKTYMKRMMQKTGLSNRTILALALQRRDILMMDSLGRVIEP